MIHERAVGIPRLEHHPAGGGKPEQTLLESFPFTIGRNDTADLCIPSSRVSREHAVVLKRGAVYRVQDLGSTNKTFLNGKQIEEAVLHDGDLVAFADVEFNFFSGSPPPSRQTATQLIDARDGRQPADVRRSVREIRRMQETLVHGSFAHEYQPVMELAAGRLAGYVAVEHRCSEPVQRGRGLADIECRLTSRLRWLSRILAVEGAQELPCGTFLIVPLDASELGAEGLAESLQQLVPALGDGRRLFVEVPETAVSDSSYFHEFCDRLREADVAIAYGGFAAGSPRIGQLRRHPPELLRLAPALTEGLSRHRERRSSLEAIVRSAAEIGARVLASGIAHTDEAELCRKAGCQLAQGSFTGASPAAGRLGRSAGCESRHGTLIEG
ncbi:MAG: EAL domain-containing protein [Pirellulales bacterium]|nr:EAL domain-containing protein [Pirellulales bacterium]